MLLLLERTLGVELFVKTDGKERTTIGTREELQCVSKIGDCEHDGLLTSVGALGCGFPATNLYLLHGTGGSGIAVPLRMIVSRFKDGAMNSS